MAANLLEMKHITKRFGRVKAVDDVSLALAPGQVLSLCGENGSGKSTLMKVLAGIYPEGSFDGEILFGGEPLRAQGIRDTELKGIAIIHQELALVKTMTVRENMFLGAEWQRYGVMDDAGMYARCQRMLAQVRLDVDPDTPVGELGLGQQQLVEIAKGLNKQVRLLILEEPTASLTEKETALLLAIIDDLRNHDIACIYISHKLNEVKAISDVIAVIRDGKPIATCPAHTLSEDRLINLMVGRALTELYPRAPHTSGKEILRVAGLNAWHPVNQHIKRVNNAAFTLRQGEILGIAGLVGSGRTEMVQCLFGVYPGRWEGEITLNGAKVRFRHCRQAMRQGIAMVPEDRKKDGIIPVMGVCANITLAALDNVSGPLSVIDEAREQSMIDTALRRLRVKTASPALAIGRLSGANQQKAILAKCLLLNPQILILDEPTRGIDIGAKQEIYLLINQLVQQGIAVIVISSELPEVLGISDRVLAMHQGFIKADLPNRGLTQEQVMEAALRSVPHVETTPR
ncbi:xylose ABC transporter ATP-binding protein [Sodalis praecaptivus]|uniref:xylose ABC transporter ATP-binding protein n=1 Tax=Sodalis praecaptivus TaxID=1239307 RepID=UPI0027FB52F4|nr:xylose ABC transporter ATP-binding protein [Sodalis praecaptivus]CAJ1000038.1 Xylose import ATP-binding protein XylG [Sodalis praecaptivus]